MEKTIKGKHIRTKKETKNKMERKQRNRAPAFIMRRMMSFSTKGRQLRVQLGRTAVATVLPIRGKPDASNLRACHDARFGFEFPSAQRVETQRIQAMKRILTSICALLALCTLSLSAVVHKAFVEVNEEGTEAAAATAVAAVATAARLEPPIPTFRADRPFLFLIRDSQSDTILFIGRMVNPYDTT